jgi:hypothetical protein
LVGVACAGCALFEADGDGWSAGVGLLLVGPAVVGAALEAGSLAGVPVVGALAAAVLAAGVLVALPAAALGTTDSAGAARSAPLEQLARPKSAVIKSARPARRVRAGNALL